MKLKSKEIIFADNKIISLKKSTSKINNITFDYVQ